MKYNYLKTEHETCVNLPSFSLPLKGLETGVEKYKGQSSEGISPEHTPLEGHFFYHRGIIDGTMVLFHMPLQTLLSIQ